MTNQNDEAEQPRCEPETQSKNQGRNVQQHYVTASYLVGFTPAGTRDSQLYVYERNTEKMFRLVPDEAAKRRNYYSIPTPTGDFDDRVDEALTELENKGIPSLRKLLVKDYNLSALERAHLAYLIAFQEFRTPWARANFQKMELSLTEQLMRFSAKVPGYLERILAELAAVGKNDGSVSADHLRDALKNNGIKLVAKPHAGIDLMVSTSQTVGNFYTQMRWTVLQATEGEFLTSDAPVVRRDAGYDGNGFYGMGLMIPLPRSGFPFPKQRVSLSATMPKN
jgi:Protein of unknown function (DUF4238)